MCRKKIVKSADLVSDGSRRGLVDHEGEECCGDGDEEEVDLERHGGAASYVGMSTCSYAMCESML